MALAEKVSETVGEWKQELRNSVDRLREEVAELKDKVRSLVPFRRRGEDVPVRHEAGSRAGDPWSGFGGSLDPWSERMFGWPGVGVMEWPRVDVREREDTLEVRAELPGVEEDDVEVVLGPRTLTLRGESRTEREDRGRDYLRHECFYGSFHRTVPLPCEVERDRAEATFRRGVLTVTLPKTREARERVRRIPIRNA